MNEKSEKEMRNTFKRFSSKLAHKLCEIEYGGSLPRNAWKTYDHQKEYYEMINGMFTSLLDNFLAQKGQAEPQEQPHNEDK